MKKIKAKSLLLGTAMVMAAGSAMADGVTIPTAPPVSAPVADGRFATLFGAPNAVAPSNGFASVGLTWANPRGGIAGASADGDVSLAYTFGNPVSGVAVTAGLSVTGLEPFGDAGQFSLEASRLVNVSARSATFVGLSAGGLGAWGAGKRDANFAGYVTQVGAMGKSETPYIWSLGYGTDNTFSTDGTGTLKDGFVWGAGVGVIPGVSLSISGTETQLNAGVTLASSSLPGWSVQMGVFDVTENVKRRQTAITVGYGFDTKGIFK